MSDDCQEMNMIERREVAIGGKMFMLDYTTRMLEHARGQVRLTARECALLDYLLNHKGEALSRCDLLREAWEWEFAESITTKTVDVHVNRLRNKLRMAGVDPAIIVALRGRGYMLAA